MRYILTLSMLVAAFAVAFGAFSARGHLDVGKPVPKISFPAPKEPVVEVRTVPQECGASSIICVQGTKVAGNPAWHLSCLTLDVKNKLLYGNIDCLKNPKEYTAKKKPIHSQTFMPDNPFRAKNPQ